MTTTTRFQCDACGTTVEKRMPFGWAKITGETFFAQGTKTEWSYDLCDACYKTFGPITLNPDRWVKYFKGRDKV